MRRNGGRDAVSPLVDAVALPPPVVYKGPKPQAFAMLAPHDHPAAADAAPHRLVRAAEK